MLDVGTYVRVSPKSVFPIVVHDSQYQWRPQRDRTAQEFICPLYRATGDAYSEGECTDMPVPESIRTVQPFGSSGPVPGNVLVERLKRVARTAIVHSCVFI